MRTRHTCRRLGGQLLQRQPQKQLQKPRHDQPQKQQQLLAVLALVVLPARLLLGRLRLALLLAAVVRSVRLRWQLHTVWVSSFLLLALRQGCASYPQRWTLHAKLLMQS
jgi:hypothetical protein